MSCCVYTALRIRYQSSKLGPFLIVAFALLCFPFRFSPQHVEFDECVTGLLRDFGVEDVHIPSQKVRGMAHATAAGVTRNKVMLCLSPR